MAGQTPPAAATMGMGERVSLVLGVEAATSIGSRRMSNGPATARRSIAHGPRFGPGRLRMVLAAGTRWARHLLPASPSPKAPRSRPAAATAFAGRFCAIGAIGTGVALPVVCIGEEAKTASSHFRFEDFRSKDLEIGAEQAREALESMFPLGSVVDEVNEFLLKLGADCYPSLERPEGIVCRYGHTRWITARFPPFPVLQEWITVIGFDSQDRLVTAYKVETFLTGP